MVKTAVICAAGLGSRLGLNLPKCMVEIGNKRLIDHILENLKSVQDVRIVVGFKEEEVIKYVRERRRDVTFIRNPNYNSTTNAYSLHLGSYDLQEPYINVDGDMILEPNSFKKFLEACEGSETDIIGVTEAKTEDAVFVSVDENNKVNAFSREKISNLEWSGIAYFKNVKISKEGKYVYQEIESYLPVNAFKIECFEIDTPADLDYAITNIDFL